MPRTYDSKNRANAAARTRARILEVARELVPSSATLSVDAIAAAAGVSVQTLYTHFGSKRGLLLAVIDTTQRDVGLYVDFEQIWQSPDGETALRRMLEATFRLWHGAWPLVAFSERARRTDDEIERYLREVDGYRLANLRSITDQVELEGRLRPGIDAEQAADMAFAASMPSVYQRLVVVRGWSAERASSVMSDAAVRSTIDPSAAFAGPPADWSSVLRPPAAFGGSADEPDETPPRGATGR
jgi:AcrR family transcriptional regulator